MNDFGYQMNDFGYQSPIEMIASEITMQMEDNCLKAVMKNETN